MWLGKIFDFEIFDFQILTLVKNDFIIASFAIRTNSFLSQTFLSLPVQLLQGYNDNNNSYYACIIWEKHTLHSFYMLNPYTQNSFEYVLS